MTVFDFAGHATAARYGIGDPLSRIRDRCTTSGTHPGVVVVRAAAGGSPGRQAEQKPYAGRHQPGMTGAQLSRFAAATRRQPHPPVWDPSARPRLSAKSARTDVASPRAPTG